MKLGIASVLILVAAGLILGLLVSGLPANITLLILVGIAIFYLAVFRPIWIAAGLLGLVPFNILWMGVGITTLEVVYGLAYILLGISWILRKGIEVIVKGRTEGLASPITMPLLVFLAVGVLSCITGILRGHRFAHWGSDLNAIMYYGLCFISLDIIKTKERSRRVFLFILIATVLGLLKGVYVVLAKPYAEMEIFGREYPRLHQASEAGLVIFIISAAFAVILTKGYRRRAFTFLSIFLGAMQLASFVRSRWVAALFGLSFLFFAAQGRQKWNWVKLVYGGALLAALYFSVAVSFPSQNILFRSVYAIEKRYESIFTAKGEPSMITRNSEWKEARRKILQHPFLGNGLGTQITYFRYDRWFGSQTWETTRYIHNVYLYLLVNMGLLGLLSFLWLCASAIRYGLGLYKIFEDRFDRALALGISCAAPSLMVASLAGPLMTSPIMTMWLGFFMGVLVIFDRCNKKPARPGDSAQQRAGETTPKADQ